MIIETGTILSPNHSTPTGVNISLSSFGGETPKGIIFLGSYTTVGETSSFRFCLGAADSGLQNCVNANFAEDVGTSSAIRYHNSGDRCIASLSGNNLGFLHSAEVTGMSADTVSLYWHDCNGVQKNYDYVAFGGDGCEFKCVSHYVSGAAPQNTSVNELSFKPDAIISMPTVQLINYGGGGNYINDQFMLKPISCISLSSKENSLSYGWYINSGSANFETTSCLSDYLIGTAGDSLGGGPVRSSNLYNINPSGFDIHWSNTNNERIYNFICIKSDGNIDLVPIQYEASGSRTITTTTPGQKPEFLFSCFHNYPMQVVNATGPYDPPKDQNYPWGTVLTNDVSFSVGFADKNGQLNHSMYCRDGTSTSRCNRSENVMCYLQGASSYEVSGTTSFFDNGFNIDFQNASLTPDILYHGYALAFSNTDRGPKQVVCEVGSIRSPTSVGNMTYHLDNFDSLAPKAFIFWGNYGGPAMWATFYREIVDGDINFSFGAAIDTGNTPKNYSITYYSQHNVGTSSTDKYISNTGCVVSWDTSSIDISATLTGVDTGNFTLYWNSVDTANINEYFYWAIGGDGVEVNLVEADSRTSAGILEVGNVGFQPDAIIFFTNNSPVFQSPGGAGRLNLGFSSGPNEDWCTHAKSEDAVTTSNTERCQSSGVWWVPNTSLDGEANRYILDSVTPSGFKLDCLETTVGSPRKLMFLCLKGVNAKVGYTNEPNPEPGNVDINDIGFLPESIFFLHIGNPTADTIQTNSLSTFFASDFRNTRSVSVGDGDNDGTTSCIVAYDKRIFAPNFDAATGGGANDALAITGVHDSGVNLRYYGSSWARNGRYLGYLAIGSPVTNVASDLKMG